MEWGIPHREGWALEEKVDSRERMCRATCWGRVKVDWQTGHWVRGEHGVEESEGGGGGHTLWSPAMVLKAMGERSWWKKVKSGICA